MLVSRLKHQDGFLSNCLGEDPRNLKKKNQRSFELALFGLYNFHCINKFRKKFSERALLSVSPLKPWYLCTKFFLRKDFTNFLLTFHKESQNTSKEVCSNKQAKLRLYKCNNRITHILQFFLLSLYLYSSVFLSLFLQQINHKWI